MTVSHFLKFRFTALLFAFVLISAVVFNGALAQAYIPSSRTIAIRTAKNNGKGAYAIVQDVQFRAGAESVTLRESWVVQDGENMRVSVVGPANQSIRFDNFYKGGKKTAIDSSGLLKTSNIPPEFIEKYPHFRTSAELLGSFVRAGIVPQSFLQDRQHFNPNPNAKNPHVAEPYVRLGRSNGVVNWVFGAATPADSSKVLPAAWIEQDAFSLRRLRFSTEAELNSNQYALQSGNFMYPRERTVTWNGNTAVIRLVSMKPLTPQAVATALNPASLTPAEAKAARLPDQANVKEFYSRFR